MAEFKNELSWSITRSRMLRACARRYYYHYYLSWEGWNSDAPPERRKAYLLKKMVNLDMLAGQIVHDVIREMFDRERDNFGPVTCEQARKLALTQLRDAWRHSKEKLWKRSPKRYANLFEHYYGQEVTAGRCDEIKHRIDTCLVNFFGSETLKFIRNGGVGSWLTVDEMKSFELAGVTVFAAPDFALRDGPGVRLYDWKTGKRDGQAAEQLLCYVLFAMAEWRVRPHLIAPFAVYLRERKIDRIEVTGERLEQLREHIRASLDEMVNMLLSVEYNLPRDIAVFARTEDAARCQRCFFRELCESEPEWIEPYLHSTGR